MNAPNVTAPYSIAFLGVAPDSPAAPDKKFDTIEEAVKEASTLKQPKVLKEGGGVFVMGTLKIFGRSSPIPLQKVEAQ